MWNRNWLRNTLLSSESFCWKKWNEIKKNWWKSEIKNIIYSIQQINGNHKTELVNGWQVKYIWITLIFLKKKKKENSKRNGWNTQNIEIQHIDLSIWERDIIQWTVNTTTTWFFLLQNFFWIEMVCCYPYAILVAISDLPE